MYLEGRASSCARALRLLRISALSLSMSEERRAQEVQFNSRDMNENESLPTHEPLAAEVPAVSDGDSAPYLVRITASGKIGNFVKFAMNFLQVSVHVDRHWTPLYS